jgi:hypothetical protein
MKSTKSVRRVFLSHAGSDTWIARQIARGIRTSGAQPFLDEAEIQAGQDFESEILSFLKRAHELVVLLTPWSLDRPYVWAELGAAWIRKIPIVVLLQGVSINELQNRPGAPVFLKKTNCRELNDVDTYFSELRRRVKNGRIR